MSGTDKVVTLKDVKDDLNQILDRLSAIEVILNDPMHGIEFPEGVKVDVGAGIESFDGNYVVDSANDPATMYDMNYTAAVDNIDTIVTDNAASEQNSGWSDETTIQIQSTSRGHNQ